MLFFVFFYFSETAIEFLKPTPQFFFFQFICLSLFHSSEFFVLLAISFFFLAVFAFQQFFFHSQNQSHLLGFLRCTRWWWWRRRLNHFKLFRILLTNQFDFPRLEFNGKFVSEIKAALINRL